MLSQIMRKLAPVVSICSLLIILIYAVQVFLGIQRMDIFIMMTNISTVAWFVFSPFWLISNKKK